MAAAALLACSVGLQAQDRQAKIAWLSRNAAPIRSIDPNTANDDFADLQPLAAAIGTARVVVLGEQSHGEGATFLAKGRLVKFLHERLGFDVLAWEAGEFNCQDMDAAVRDPATPLQDAINRGLYPIWGLSAQVRPVFEYARQAAVNHKPLEMAGFDHQFSGTGGAARRWRDAMIAFIDRADPDALPPALRASLREGTDLLSRGDATPAELRALAEKWKALPDLLDTLAPRLRQVYGARRTAFMRRTAGDALISLEGLARFRESSGAFRAADNNYRDRRMAENLLWLVNERYKERRVIVWAATFHTLHEPAAIDLGPDSDFSYKNVVTMGQIVRAALGHGVYTIGFTAAEGHAANVMGGMTMDLQTAEDNSLEDLWMRTERRFAFVNLRTLPAQHWLEQPVSARLLSHSPITTAWPRQVDGIVFTRTMFPATKGPVVPDGAVITDEPLPRPPG